MAAPTLKRMTYADYLQLELDTGIKHEFVGGRAYAMSGGTLRHSVLGTYFTTFLNNALADRPCRALNSDAKLRTLISDVATYPDAAVVCGPIEPHPEDPNAYTNPILVAEVLSASTEAWDRGGKFDVYASVESLRYYVLLATTQDQVEIFERQDSGSWLLRKYQPGDVAVLEDLGIRIDVDALFSDLPALPADPDVKRMDRNTAD